MEKRKYGRVRVALRVLLDPPDKRCIEGYTLNISSDGVYIKLFEQVAQPKLGTTLTVQFNIWTGQDNISRSLRAKVARIDAQGIALQFSENDLVSSAIVQDICHYRQFERRAVPRPCETVTEDLVSSI